MAQYKKLFDVNKERHAQYFNNNNTRTVVIAKNPEEEIAQMHKILLDEQDVLNYRCPIHWGDEHCNGIPLFIKNYEDKITWIPEKYRETQKWAQIVRGHAATNVLIWTGSFDTDLKVYQQLTDPDALLIENENLQPYMIQNPQLNIQFGNVQNVLLEFDPLWDENNDIHKFNILENYDIQVWTKNPTFDNQYK